MAEEFISTAIAERMRNFSWKPWHAHRVLHQKPEPIAQRIARLRAAHARTKLADHEYLADLHAEIVVGITIHRGITDNVCDAFLR